MAKNAEAPVTATAVEQQYDPMKDMVTVHLPRATGKEEDSLFVGLNGKGYTIKKGVPVRVPRPVYDILMERERQIERQAAFEEEQQRKAAEKDKMFGLF